MRLKKAVFSQQCFFIYLLISYAKSNVKFPEPMSFFFLNVCNTLINWTRAFLVEVDLGGVGTKQKDKGRKLSGVQKVTDLCPQLLILCGSN